MKGFFDLKLINNPTLLSNFLENNNTDLILLDVHMPIINGIDLFKNRIATEYSNIPVILITADQAEDIIIKGLELGAEDVITKPISLRELVARIQNKINIHKISRTKNNDNKISYENFTLDCEMHLAVIENKKIHLTPIEFKILHLLSKNPNKVYSKDDMKLMLWPNIHVQNQNMDTHLSNLRKKLTPFSKKIKTIKSRGYVLNI